MMRSRLTLSVLATTALLLVLGAQPAGAKQTPKKSGVSDLKVTPATPSVTDTLRVSFIAGKIARNERYDVSLVLTSSRSEACITSRSVRIRGQVRRGRRISVEFSPVGGGGNGRFCEGPARVLVRRANVEQRFVLAASRTVQVAPGLDDPGVPNDTPVRVDVLDGSSLLVQAPGRPDRSLPVGGVLRGVLPGKFKPHTDLEPKSLTGQLWLRTVSPDALCAGSLYASELGVPPSAPASMMLRTSGEASMALTLGVAPAALAGCASPPPGTTPLALSGKIGAQGLVRLGLSGSVTGVPISDGVTATVTMNLLVRLDLSGS